MVNKEQRIEKLKKLAYALRCPICKNGMRVIDNKSLICTHNHTFDIAKQGYVNFLPRPSKNGYTKLLFAARRKMITERHLFHPMHDAIVKTVAQYWNVANDGPLIADLGCGEGSHLLKILEKRDHPSAIGVGLDISKEGVLLAARHDANCLWIVGDLAQSPLANHSVQVILNILSPSNYNEFNRILDPSGLVIKVVPGPQYLMELRQALLVHSEKKYANDQTTALFQKHFRLAEKISLSYKKRLAQEELHDLVQMTPLAWSADPACIDAFLSQNHAQITIDLDILVGVKA